FPHRILIGPETMGGGLVNDGHLGAVFAHGSVKVAAAHEGNAHGLQVSGSHVVHDDQHAIAVGATFLAFGENAAAEASAEQGNVGSQGGSLDAGHVLHRLQNAALELLYSGRVVIEGAQVKGKHGQVVSVEAGIGFLGIAQAEEEQAGADQGHQAKRDLGDDEGVAQGKAAASENFAAGALLQFQHQVGAGSLKGGGQAENQARAQSDAQGKQQHSAVEGQAEIALLQERRAKLP